MSKPNFLVIMSDQHSPDAIGASGHPAVKTPALDSLENRGVTFTSAYCNYPMCTPSRASFMTGLLASDHGVWELGSSLRSDIPTWAHALRGAGYQTSISGRMHFIGPDQMHGFERRVHPGLSKDTSPHTYGDWDKPQEDDHVMLGALDAADPQEEPTRGQNYDVAVTEAALKELEHLTSDEDGRPWALMVGLYLPHFPFKVSQEYFDLYDDVEIPMPRTPPDGKGFEELVPEQMTDNRKWLGLTSDGATEEQIRMARRCYYGMISHLDEQIGKLVTRLEATGKADNTWIIYLSDHGENLGEHGFWSKLNFWEDSVRIPCVIVPPRCEVAGQSCAAPVSLVDIFPTLLDLTQTESPEGLAGNSLLPLLQNPSQTWPDRAIISDYACDGTRVPMRMIRKGPWKACFASGFPPTLFDLETDPHEWIDLGQDQAHGDLIQELSREAKADELEHLREEIVIHKRRLKSIAAAVS